MGLNNPEEVLAAVQEAIRNEGLENGAVVKILLTKFEE